MTLITSNLLLEFRIALVTVLLLERHDDQGKSYRRKHLNGGLLIASEAQSIIFMAQSMVAGRCGGEVAESCILIHKLREEGGSGMGF